MKKYILSFLMVMTFAVYVVYQRLNGTGNPVASISSTVSIPISAPRPTTVPIATNPVVKPTPKPTPTPVPVVVPVVVTNTGLYKNGQYTGVSADAYYGNIQVQITVSGGSLTDVQFLDYPQDRSTSVRINTHAMPILRQEAIQAQNSNVNTVSGATDSSGAFRQSLESALVLAKN